MPFPAPGSLSFPRTVHHYRAGNLSQYRVLLDLDKLCLAIIQPLLAFIFRSTHARFVSTNISSCHDYKCSIPLQPRFPAEAPPPPFGKHLLSRVLHDTARIGLSNTLSRGWQTGSDFSSWPLQAAFLPFPVGHKFPVVSQKNEKGQHCKVFHVDPETSVSISIKEESASVFVRGYLSNPPSWCGLNVETCTVGLTKHSFLGNTVLLAFYY